MVQYPYPSYEYLYEYGSDLLNVTIRVRLRAYLSQVPSIA